MYDVYIMTHEKVKALDDSARAEELAFIEARTRELRAQGLGGSTVRVRRQDSYDFRRMRLDEPQEDGGDPK